MSESRSAALAALARSEQAVARRLFTRAATVTMQQRVLLIASALYEVERVCVAEADRGSDFDLRRLDDVERNVAVYVNELKALEQVLGSRRVTRVHHARDGRDI